MIPRKINLPRLNCTLERPHKHLRWLHYKSLAALLLLLGTWTAAEAAAQAMQAPDTIFTNGSIYTVNETQPWVEAIAINEGRLSYLGDTATALGLASPMTRVIDLKGKMVMPGIIDAHVHPVLGGMERATQCLFPSKASLTMVEKTLRECELSHEHRAWIVGGRWDSAFFSVNNIDSPRNWLDAIFPDKPVSLADDTGHNRWVNTAALKLLGYENGGVVPGGEVVLDSQGRPNGILHEAAIYPLLTKIQADMPPSPKDYEMAARTAISDAHRFGITGLKEAGDADKGIAAYQQLDLGGALDMHIDACIAASVNAKGELDFVKIRTIVDQNPGNNLTTRCVKLFLDGVPSEARTAAMLEPYKPDAQGKRSSGELITSTTWIDTAVLLLDKNGFVVKAHTAGDRSVRVFLDAVEKARETNGPSGIRHELAHAGFIADSDVARLKMLDVAADMSPAIWFPSPVIDSIRSAVGEKRAKNYFPFRTLINAGATVFAGSDWPAVVQDMNPWNGIEAAVTRRNPTESRLEQLGAQEAISLKEVLQLYTLNNAASIGLEDKTGSLELGKWADVIVLNHSLFDIAPERISETRIELLLFKGKRLYGTYPREARPF